MITRRTATWLLAAGASAAAAPTETRKTRGAPMAKVTVEVFSDFQCPACKVLHEQTLKPLTADYVDAGKVHLIHRDFPLPMHAHARQAAALACAAARIGKYELVADALFKTQDTWATSGNVGDVILQAVGAADATKIRQLANTPPVSSEIEADIQKGEAAKLTQTPTMIVTSAGKTYPVAGAVTYPIFRRFLDQLLSQ